MNDFILFLHFIGLALAAAGGVATGTIMRRAADAAAASRRLPLRGLGPTLVNMTATGVAILWITGHDHGVEQDGDGFENLPPLVLGEARFRRDRHPPDRRDPCDLRKNRRTGDVSLARRLPMIGPLNGLAALLAVLFAAYAFH